MDKLSNEQSFHQEEDVQYAYCETDDMTFIYKDYYLVNSLTGEKVFIKTELVGFHYGEPGEESHKFIGKMVAEY